MSPDNADEIHQGAQPYNLRKHPKRTTRLNADMDLPHSTKSYSAPTQFIQTHAHQEQRLTFGHVFTQMSAKAAIKKHGSAAVDAMMAEFAQLQNFSVYKPLDSTKLTHKKKRSALRSINLIKEKRDGRLKGRTVADGRPQRALYQKSDITSPTVSSEALLLSLLIDAHEGRDVATADVVGAYLRAYMDDEVIMKFSGEFVDILLGMKPEYETFVVLENGVKVLYVLLLKAMYGCVKSALLWYKIFTETLENMGFVLNPYEPCMANCIIKGKQCTIAWYVDDNKISHVDPEVVSMVKDKIEAVFDKMTVTRGRDHNFLGMKVHFWMTTEQSST
jgi:Reverse transcriptase (RNA-dependent DNA polymerase)